MATGCGWLNGLIRIDPDNPKQNLLCNKYKHFWGPLWHPFLFSSDPFTVFLLDWFNPVAFKQGSSEDDSTSNFYDRSKFKVVSNCCSPTAVAWTMVILWNNFRWICFILEDFFFFKLTICGHVELFWTIWNRFGQYWNILDSFDTFGPFFTLFWFFKLIFWKILNNL